MELTKGESLIIKMLINIKTDFSAFSDMVIAKMFIEQMKDEKSINDFNLGMDNIRKEKQTEIVAQLKNLYSDKLGNIDDLLNDILED
jgi:alpha/beta superfamily hydrolase